MKTSIAVLCITLGALLCGSCKKSAEASDKKSYALISNGVAPYWEIAKQGAETAAKELGVPVTVLMPTNGVVDQKQMIEDMVIRGTTGIAVSPADSENQTELLNKIAASTKLITMDSDAPKSKRLLYIGMDNYKAGRMAGQLVKEAMPQGGSVAIFVGRAEQDNARLRRQGLIDELLDRSSNPERLDEVGALIDGGRYKILPTLVDQFDRAKAKTYVEDTLTRTPDVGCMVGLFVYNTPVIVETLTRTGKLGQVKVVGFDEADETLAAVSAGHVQGTVVQNPYEYGYQSIKWLHEIANGTATIPVNQFIDIPARMLRKDDISAFQQEMKAKLGK